MIPFGVGKVGIVTVAGFHPASLRDTFSNALLSFKTGNFSSIAAKDILLTSN